MSTPPIAIDLVAARALLVCSAARFGIKINDEADIPSPCISVCRMDGDVCTGCLRTLDEIRAWSRADAVVRRAIWLRIGERAAAFS